jgi:hypothetical protein
MTTVENKIDFLLSREEFEARFGEENHRVYDGAFRRLYLEHLKVGVGLGNPVEVLKSFDHPRRKRALSMESDFESTYVNKEFLGYLENIYWGGEDKQVLGRNLSELLIPVSDGNGGEKPRFNIPERMIHETMHDQIARVSAIDLKNVVKELGIGGSNPTLVELNTGLGSWLFRLGDAGFDIRATVERNPYILKATKEIWNGLNINGVNFVNSDAWDFVKDQMKNGVYDNKEITVITADPPWGKYISNGEKYDFSMFEPDGRIILKRLVKYAPIVAMKLPGNFKENEIKSLSEELNMGVRYFDYSLMLGSQRIGEGMAVFISCDINGQTNYQHTQKVVR